MIQVADECGFSVKHLDHLKNPANLGDANALCAIRWYEKKVGNNRIHAGETVLEHVSDCAIRDVGKQDFLKALFHGFEGVWPKPKLHHENLSVEGDDLVVRDCDRPNETISIPVSSATELASLLANIKERACFTEDLTVQVDGDRVGVTFAGTLVRLQSKGNLIAASLKEAQRAAGMFLEYLQQQ